MFSTHEGVHVFLDDFYKTLNPVAFSLGPLTVRWYGIAYLLGFVLGGLLLFRIARRWKLGLSSEDVLNVATGVCLGIVIGGRLGYVLFYGAGEYLKDPLSIFALNQGGMSFHGGLVGAVVGGAIVCRVHGYSMLTMSDLVVCVAPIGLFFGRCANFVNGELWGKETDLPWGVMFPTGGNVYRHPSQLYEALLEGLVLFLIMWTLSRKVPPRPQGTFAGVFLVWYGICRILIEFVRVPDAQLGYLFGGFVTMGQLLSLPLVIVGIALLVWAHRTQRPQVGRL